jgi:hypothetical protein
MKRNIGKVDRLVRIGAGMVLGVLYLTGAISATLLIVLAAIVLVTSIAAFCPLYRICGISTHRNK